MILYDEFQKIARKYHVSTILIRKEYWELVILNELLQDNKISPYLILKGGLALKFGHNSPRFSDDIDLAMANNISFNDFSRAIKRIAKKYRLQVTDLWEKQYTYMGEFKVSQTKNANENFRIRIKVELSKRELSEQFQIQILHSDLFPAINPNCYVLTIDSLYETKLQCLKTRKKPRDIFDFWYLSNILRKNYVPVRISPAEEATIRRELQMYLPKRLYNVIPSLYQIDESLEGKKDETEGYYPEDFSPEP